jgi:hypothetical protein
MPSALHDDDENFETIIGHDGRPVRILRDGGRIRVGLLMADAARRGAAMLHDGHGGPVGGKPGFIITDESERIRNEAYRASVSELSNAWRGPSGDAAPSAETAPMSYADAICTDLHILIARLNDARRSAYEAHVHELTNAWRGPT